MTEQSFPAAGSAVSLEKASLVRRLIAYFIDLIILGVVDRLVMIPFPNKPFIPQLIPPAIDSLYFIAWYSTTGQTIGKSLLGIEVVSVDGTALNWRKGVLRFIGYVVSALPLGIGFLWAIRDRDKQAGQDKIAGTYVIKPSLRQQQVWETIDPREIQQRRRRWLIGLGIPSLVIIAGILYFISGILAEVRQMGPWPGSEIPLTEVASSDLSQLGFAIGQPIDARKLQVWQQGIYKDGVEVSYWLGQEEVAQVFALRYDNWLSASDDFNVLSVWNLEPNHEFITYGKTRCQFSNQDNRIFWNGNLIVHIVTFEGSKFAPDMLADLVRDALTAHWKTLVKS